MMVISRRSSLQGIRAFSGLAEQFGKRVFKEEAQNLYGIFCCFDKEVLTCVRDNMEKARKGLLKNVKFGSNWYHRYNGSGRTQSQGMRREKLVRLYYCLKKYF